MPALLDPAYTVKWPNVEVEEETEEEEEEEEECIMLNSTPFQDLS